MARILVTGAGGFLGRYAVTALREAGWTVIGSGRSAPCVDGLDTSIAADLLQQHTAQQLVERAKADVLLHLAWFDDPSLRWHAADNLAWAAATLNLAQYFAAAGGKRVVYGSSCAVYDFSVRTTHKETDLIAPKSLYGEAKASAGTLITAAQKALGITVAEARIFFCYGAGEQSPRLVPDLVTGISQGKPVACTDGAQKRDYLHASDVGRALQLLADSEITGPVNIASGHSIPVAQLIGEIARQMGRPDLPQLGAISRPEADPADISADVSRLQQLGFEPRHSLLSGVTDTLLQSGVKLSN